MTKFTQKAYSY